jgi:hypothetical protein
MFTKLEASYIKNIIGVNFNYLADYIKTDEFTKDGVQFTRYFLPKQGYPMDYVEKMFDGVVTSLADSKADYIEFYYNPEYADQDADTMIIEVGKEIK